MTTVYSFRPVYTSLESPMPKNAGDPFGVTLWFKHRGPAETVFVGIGLAPGRTWSWFPPDPGWSHGEPSFFLYRQVEINEDHREEWYSVVLETEFPAVMGSGSGTMDVWRFISYDEPVGDQKPTEVIKDNWDDDKYSTTGASMENLFGMMMPMMMMMGFMPMLTGGLDY